MVGSDRFIRICRTIPPFRAKPLRTVFVACFLIILGAFGAPAALACSCVPVEDAEAHLDSVDVIFRGEVVKTRKNWFSRETGPVKTEFKVIRVYRGAPGRSEPGSRIKVSHALDGAMCGLTFTRGEEVLVLAHRSGKKISTGLCTMLPVQADEATYLDIVETRPPK